MSKRNNNDHVNNYQKKDEHDVKIYKDNINKTKISNPTTKINIPSFENSNIHIIDDEQSGITQVAKKNKSTKKTKIKKAPFYRQCIEYFKTNTAEKVISLFLILIVSFIATNIILINQNIALIKQSIKYLEEKINIINCSYEDKDNIKLQIKLLQTDIESKIIIDMNDIKWRLTIIEEEIDELKIKN